jgi:hypothetical protein
MSSEATSDHCSKARYHGASVIGNSARLATTDAGANWNVSDADAAFKIYTAPSYYDYVQVGVIAGDIKLDDLGATDDNTDLDASITAHGLMPKLPNVATQFFDGTGAWAILATSDIPDLSAIYQPLDTALTNISALVYVSPSLIKLTANDTYAVRTLSEVRTDLGLVIGTNVMAWDAQLDDLAALALTDSNFIVGDGTNWIVESGATARASLGIDLSLYYLKTEIDSQEEVEAIWGVTLPIVTGSFTVGNLMEYDSAEVVTIKDAGIAVTEVSDAVTKKHTQNTDTQFDFYNALGSDHTWSGDKDTQPVGESVVLGDLLYFNWATVTGTDIAFVDGGAGEDTITQVAAKFLEIGLVVGDVITVSGSASNDGDYTIISVVAGTINVATGSLTAEGVGASVTITSPYEWKKADADSSNTMPGLRIALESKTNGQACLMLVKGYIRDDSAFEFAGAMPGAMSSTAPSTAGQQVQRVGVAKSADILFFNPSIDVGEI